MENEQETALGRPTLKLKRDFVGENQALGSQSTGHVGPQALSNESSTDSIHVDESSPAFGRYLDDAMELANVEWTARKQFPTALQITSKCQRHRTFRIYFENDRVVKRLSRMLQREVQSWGDTLLLSHAHTMVARVFGHAHYSDFHARLGVADPSQADALVGADEREARFRQYVRVLSENDFSVSEAEAILTNIVCGPWWGFGKDWTRPEAKEPRIRKAEVEVEFLDKMTVYRLYRVFKRSVHRTGVEVPEGRKHLLARLFGHESFNKMILAAAKGRPSVPDYFMSPEALDQRVYEYLSILQDAGFDQEAALSVLDSGYGGWWGLVEDEWDLLRQARDTDCLEHGHRPRWRPRRVEQIADLFVDSTE